MIEYLFSLEGKVALVTGGAKGIGAMMTQGLIEAGAKVYVASRAAQACASFADEMNKLGKGECIGLSADLLDAESMGHLVAEMSRREDHLDILINNSGASWGAPLGQFPEKGWDKVMDLNVKSVFFLTQAMLPMLKAAGNHDDPSRIIIISSVAAKDSESLSAYSYGPSKAAVAQLGKLLARDLAKDNILVNTIAPGVFESRMTSHFDLEAAAKQNPVKRIGKPEDLAGLVLYLCSRAGGYMTGNYIPLDGGFLIR